MNILLNDVLNEWGISSLPQNRQSELVENLSRVIYQAILVKSLEILPIEDQQELDVLLDKDETTPEDVLRFLKLKVPNFEKILLEERKKLKSEVIPAFSDVRG